MKIKMLEDKSGSEDGIKVRTYHKDCIYDLADSLACSFMNSGLAYNVEEGEDGDSRERALKIAAAREQVFLRNAYYHWMLTGDATAPIFSFDEWLRLRLQGKPDVRVPTNPATLVATGRIER